MILSLFWHFAAISLLAFGGGKAALPLIERLCVAQMGWISPATFAAAVGFGFLAPGPVLITATFIGYQVAGVPGALSATLGIFLMPVLLAAGAAHWVKRLSENRWLRAFGQSATPAVVGLLFATAWSLGRSSLNTWLLVAVASASCLIALRSKIAPGWSLLGGALVGWLMR